MKYILVAVTAVWFGTCCQLRAEGVAEVESRVMANRLAIRQWHIRILWSGMDRRPEADRRSSPLERRPPPSILEYRVDGDWIRTDTTWPYGATVPGVQEPTYTETTIWGAENVVRWSTRRYGGDSRRALTVTALSLDQTPKGQRFVDVRFLGILPDSLMAGEVSDFIGNPDRTELRIADDVMGGLPCKMMSYVLNGGDVRYWFSPEKGYCAIRAETEFGKEESWHYRGETDVAVDQHKDTGIWFPVSAEYSRFREEKLIDREIAKIEVLSLNTPLDREAFSLSSLDLPVGLTVYLHPGSEANNYFWDGSKIVAERAVRKSSNSVVSYRRLFAFIGAAFLAAACGALLWKARRRS